MSTISVDNDGREVHQAAGTAKIKLPESGYFYQLALKSLEAKRAADREEEIASCHVVSEEQSEL